MHNHNHHHGHNEYLHHKHDGDISHHKEISARLLFSVLLNFLISLVQIIGGIISGSLSLVSDSLHNLSDSLSIFFSYAAGRISERKSDKKKTYGYKRVEILTAFFNSLTLMAICIFMIYEAILRYIHPTVIDAVLMIKVAIFGLLANVASVILLSKSRNANLNIKSAYLHLLGDTVSSIAVIAGGIIIYYTQIFIIDLLLTLSISIYLLYEAYSVTVETVNILMQAVPKNIDIEKIQDELNKIPGVRNVHHIHIWSINENKIFFEGHIEFLEDIKVSETKVVIEQMEDFLQDNYDISHFTFQQEFTSSEHCEDC